MHEVPEPQGWISDWAPLNAPSTDLISLVFKNDSRLFIAANTAIQNK